MLPETGYRRRRSLRIAQAMEADMDFFWFLLGLASVIITLRIISTTFQD